ncbi:hypothetical protein CAOG_010007 [Capsaspora owczarzaki ATCC 30864]|uniref:Uncharacterized protein n=1 Tax=Capsaspora owczarzaki (strain ATCC 30864) TaxID=595528 RepID=A0A0D2WVN5_CAPO3|nr:hypothetical protein CAOG_010007 [Capsaspora owczarzaki ATCC 30864]
MRAHRDVLIKHTMPRRSHAGCSILVDRLIQLDHGVVAVGVTLVVRDHPVANNIARVALGKSKEGKQAFVVKGCGSARQSRSGDLGHALWLGACNQIHELREVRLERRSKPSHGVRCIDNPADQPRLRGIGQLGDAAEAARSVVMDVATDKGDFVVVGSQHFEHSHGALNVVCMRRRAVPIHSEGQHGHELGKVRQWHAREHDNVIDGWYSGSSRRLLAGLGCCNGGGCILGVLLEDGLELFGSRKTALDLDLSVAERLLRLQLARAQCNKVLVREREGGVWACCNRTLHHRASTILEIDRPVHDFRAELGNVELEDGVHLLDHLRVFGNAARQLVHEHRREKFLCCRSVGAGSPCGNLLLEGVKLHRVEQIKPFWRFAKINLTVCERSCAAFAQGGRLQENVAESNVNHHQANVADTAEMPELVLRVECLVSNVAHKLVLVLVQDAPAGIVDARQVVANVARQIGLHVCKVKVVVNVVVIRQHPVRAAAKEGLRGSVRPGDSVHVSEGLDKLVMRELAFVGLLQLRPVRTHHGICIHLIAHMHGQIVVCLVCGHLLPERVVAVLKVAIARDCHNPVVCRMHIQRAEDDAVGAV